MMKAAIVKELGKPLVIEQIPIPEPGPGQILVKVLASGICHTDVHAAEGDWPVKPTIPLIPGHEGAGVVHKLGSGVTNLKVGDRVGVAWLHSACSNCQFCGTGRETLCETQERTGYSVNGAYAEYMLANANYVAKLPDKLTCVEAAPILCAGVTVYKGLKVTDTKPGDWVLIVGVGGLGHVAIQYARAMGLKVAAVDCYDDKLELAKKLGASVCVNAMNEDVAKVVQAKTGGCQGAVITAVTVKAYASTLGAIRAGGTVVCIGLPAGGFDTPIFDVVLNGITIRGSIVGTRQDLAECLQIAADGLVKATIEIQPLEKVNEVFERLKKGKVNGRVVVKLADEKK